MTVLCEVCKETISKYKCSTCYSPYCSLDCWRKHKSDENCKVKPASENNYAPGGSDKKKYFTEDTVSDDKLSQLSLVFHCYNLQRGRDKTKSHLVNFVLDGDQTHDFSSGESEALRNMLKDEYLQRTLIGVDNASNPEEAVCEAMKDSDFVRFVDECLKIVEDSKD